MKRIILIALAVLLLPLTCAAQCQSVGCPANEVCSYFEGAYCSSNFLCQTGQGCLTTVGTCSDSGRVCAIRGCIERRLCPPNPFSVFALGHAAACSVRNINALLRFKSARLFSAALN